MPREPRHPRRQRWRASSTDNRTVRNFAVATVIWGLVGMSAGLLLAVELFYPGANLNFQYITFGRLRPVHTNVVIFAFVGNGMFMGIYYSLQRLCKARMFSDTLSWLHFWGWNAIIVAAALTLPQGFTSSKEYAELEWPIDIAIAVVWVVFTINLLGTILKRREKHLYVAIWFYIATALTVAVLHIVNNLEIPAGPWKSYSIYAGVQDALVQWWYGHNAVAFFLTTPYLGLMYYFLPKAANRPVFSYRLSIIHFWALIFIYIWAGPHHLLYTALPDWAQSLGTVFSIMLIAPSWGGMLNGLLTLRGAWDKVRQDPVLKFMVAAVTAYGMATLEGPTLALKSVNSISHYTDWTIAHVHTGALGWNGLLTFSMLYWLFPRLYNTRLWSVKLANYHFWIALLGMMFYVIPMYASGITQGMMWKQFTHDGFLQYPNFLEIVRQIVPMHQLRAVGGTLYITGAFLAAFNLWKTAKSGEFAPDTEVQAPALRGETESAGHGGLREEGLVEEQGQRHRFDGVRVCKTRLDGPRDRFGREPGEAHRLEIRSDAYLPSDAKAQVLAPTAAFSATTRTERAPQLSPAARTLGPQAPRAAPRCGWSKRGGASQRGRLAQRIARATGRSVSAARRSSAHLPDTSVAARAAPATTSNTADHPARSAT